jgi:hypothetical protein
MTCRDPALRPTMTDVVARFEKSRAKLSYGKVHTLLSKRNSNDFILVRVAKGTAYYVRQALHSALSQPSCVLLWRSRNMKLNETQGYSLAAYFNRANSVRDYTASDCIEARIPTLFIQGLSKCSSRRMALTLPCRQRLNTRNPYVPDLPGYPMSSRCSVRCAMT